MSRRLSSRLGAGCLAITTCLCLSCGGYQSGTPTPTPDYPVLETEVAAKLSARQTAKAPTATPAATIAPVTPPHTATPEATATILPTAATGEPGALLAYARLGDDQTANVIVRDLDHGTEMVLTHFTEPLNMSDVAWSWDGQWLVFVSTHDYIHSRNNERNVFVMRPDGTGLRMVTGEYMDPDSAPAPYAVLRGTVLNAGESCLVCAQGAPGPVRTREDGSFELPGVSLAARWARAVCQGGDLVLQGDVDLAPEDESWVPVEIPVAAEGQGWRQASLSRDGRFMAGTFYRWSLGEDGGVHYAYEGLLYDLETEQTRAVEMAEDTSLLGLAWSPVSDRLAGGLSDDSHTWLALWDAEGKNAGFLAEFSHPASEVLSVAYPAWSPDGEAIAFELRHWSWEEEGQYRIEIMAIPASGGKPRTLVPTEWGFDASHPSWSAEGSEVLYQLSVGEPGLDHQSKTNGYIWAIAIGDDPDVKPQPLIEDARSYLPAARPCVSCSERSDN